MGLHGAANETGKAFDWRVTKRLIGYITVYRHHIGISFLAMLFTVGANIVGPPMIGYAVDSGIQEGDLRLTVIAALGYLVVQALGFFAFRVQLMNMAIAGQSVIRVLRDELFTHIQHLSLSFFPTYETGRLIARVIGDVNVLREVITFSVVGIFRDFFIIIGMLIAMLIIDPALTLVAVGVVVVLGTIANFWRVYARRAYVRVRDAVTDVNAELAENFNGIRIVQAYAREKFNHQNFAGNINKKNLDANLRATLVASLFFPSIDLVGGVATGALIYFGGNLVLNDQLSVFKLITFVLYIEQFFFPIRLMAQRYNVFQATMAAGDKIFSLLDQPVVIEDKPDAIELSRVAGHVQFEDVGLAYVDDQPVLHNINLEVPAGATVALVGHTGAGKTSIVKLISRFYDTTSGRILVDGHDIRAVTLNSLRGQIGTVLQQTFLFSGTIMDNIRYGRLNATDEEVIAAARAIGAHEFICQMEKGYQSQVEEGGVMLSVGQRQLLAFARALLADPRILILDEATSSIDTRTEQIIQSALQELLKGRTSFVIAHRLSTITAADLIVVMDHGEIKEQGTHEALLAQRGIYFKLYTMTYAA
jgi:ATP-binding cassette subfamily B protein/subfamily B ATP-binding cassette protein MsbA